MTGKLRKTRSLTTRSLTTKPYSRTINYKKINIEDSEYKRLYDKIKELRYDDDFFKTK